MPIALPEFETDPYANDSHQLGIKARDTEHDYEKAMRYFNAGVERLHNAGNGLDSPHNLLQLMGVERDAVFTQVRMGIDHQSVQMIAQEHRAMEGILGYENVLSGITLDCYEDAAMTRLNAEVGACKGIAARILTVQFVMSAEEITRKEQIELADQAATEYTEAAELLAMASSPSLEASNAANYARHLRVMNQPGIAKWIGTAAACTMRTFTADRNNARDALRTTLQTASVLLDPQAAAASVLTRP